MTGLGAIFLFGFLAGNEAGADVLKLPDLIRGAQERQLQWRTAETARRKAEESVTVGRAKFLPDLALKSTYSYDWQQGAQDDETVGSTAAILSSWSIFDNGTSLRDYSISKLELAKSKFDERAARDDVTFEILSRYSRHLLLRRQKDITERKLAMLQTQYRTTERQFRQGLKTRRDYQRLQAELERARLNLLRLNDQVNDSFLELVRYVGRPDLISRMSDLEIVKSEGLLSSLQKTAKQSMNFSQAPQVESAKAQLEVARIRAREARAPLWPMINLAAELGYGSSDFAGTGQRWSDQERVFGSAQVQLHWTIFDWGGRSSGYRKAILDENLAEVSFDQTVLNVRAAFETQVRQSERQKKTTDVVRELFAVERKTFLDIQNEYREGRASYLDLITSLDRQAQAEIEQEVNAYLLVLADTLKLSGNLYDAIVGL
jgi:outer membrane protein TolC